MFPTRNVTYAKYYLYEMLPRQSAIYEMLPKQSVLYEMLLYENSSWSIFYRYIQGKYPQRMRIQRRLQRNLISL